MPKYPDIEVKLVGENGNAYAIMGRVLREMKRAKLPQTEIDAFQKEAMSGNYDNLLRTCMNWVDVV